MKDASAKIKKALAGPNVDGKEVLRLLALELVEMKSAADTKYKLEVVVEHSKVAERICNLIASRARLPVEATEKDRELETAISKLMSKNVPSPT